MNVLGIGETVFDVVKVKNKKGKYAMGGIIPSALIALSRLGIKCTLVTTIGQDHEGEIIRKILTKEHMTVISQKELKTKINTILVDDTTGKREKIRGSVVHRPIQTINSKLFNETDAILIDRHEPYAFADVLKKKKVKTKLVIDSSTEISKHTLQMIEKADYPIIPMEAVVNFNPNNTVEENIETLQAITGKPLTVTLGELGCLIYDGRNTDIIPSYDVQAVDVTGAGDIFRAGFIYGVLQNWTIHTCADFANMLAALQCTKIGNFTAIPTLRKINTFSQFAVKKELSNVLRDSLPVSMLLQKFAQTL